VEAGAGCPFRVGIGYDIHRLTEGSHLVLGGVGIPHDKGLVGHSDGDVVLHAVIDALLGAAGLPDIGECFPDTDPAYKDADSRELLADVVQRVRARGWVPGNLDMVVHAQEPKLSPHKIEIAGSIAKLIGLSAGAVSVKAKTNEGLGPIGEGLAIACTACVLLVAEGR